MLSPRHGLLTAPSCPTRPRHHSLPVNVARNPQALKGTNLRAAKTAPVDAKVGEMQELELALLRRGVDQLSAGAERCGHCQRTPLIGERVYVFEKGPMLCELCRAMQSQRPLASRMVHGPEFGHTMRITDQRAAA